jgi:putative transposase
MRETDAYKQLPDKVAKGTIRKLYDNLKSFFQAIKAWKINPSKFLGKPKLLKYLDIFKGRFMVIYERDAIGTKNYKKDKTLKLSQTNIIIKPKIDNKYIKQIHLTKENNSYVVNICYESKEPKPNNKPIKHGSIDLGINNLATLVFEHTNKPIIYSGKPLKSINQGWNKRKAKYQSLLNIKDFEYSSLKIRKETDKRNRRVKDYLHKVSADIVNQIEENQVTDLIIGYNEGWKQDISIGKVVNQKFVNIPYLKFVNMLKYKCYLRGIRVIMTEESYTSKCSFIDGEELKFHQTYKGSRVCRGLFISSKGVKINADINGSYNILRKVVPRFKYEKGIVALKGTIRQV